MRALETVTETREGANRPFINSQGFLVQLKVHGMNLAHFIHSSCTGMTELQIVYNSTVANVVELKSICDIIQKRNVYRLAFSVVCVGDHLCEVGTAVYCTCPATGGTELSSYLYSSRHAPGREVGINWE